MSRYFQTLAIYKYAGLPDPQVDGVSTWQPLLQLAGCLNKIGVDLRLALKGRVGVEMSFRKDCAIMYILLGCTFRLIRAMVYR